MIARATVIWLGIAVLAGFGLFQLKYAVQDQERRLADLQILIVKNREAIHVLRAEWSFLTAPDRLKRLGERHLALEPMARAQLGHLADLPARTEGRPPPTTVAGMGQARAVSGAKVSQASVRP